MELLDGETLARLVEREGPQSVERTRHILGQVVAALGEAHEAELVHRDIKPANVMLCPTAGCATAFAARFVAAKTGAERRGRTQRARTKRPFDPLRR